MKTSHFSHQTHCANEGTWYQVKLPLILKWVFPCQQRDRKIHFRSEECFHSRMGSQADRPMEPLAWPIDFSPLKMKMPYNVYVQWSLN